MIIFFRPLRCGNYNLITTFHKSIFLQLDVQLLGLISIAIWIETQVHAMIHVFKKTC
jgi:hypothetical protein